jgi:hypothetical protein
MMSDDDLKKLGVAHLGDRVILRNICKNLQRKLMLKGGAIFCVPCPLVVLKPHPFCVNDQELLVVAMTVSRPEFVA